MSSDNSWFYSQQSRYRSVAGPNSTLKISPEALIGMGVVVLILLYILKKKFQKSCSGFLRKNQIALQLMRRERRIR